MSCSSCGRSIYTSRSSHCIACAASLTLQEEFRAEWPSEKLRVLAGDIALSAARHVRGLRVAAQSGNPGATAKSAAVRPREAGPARTSPRPPLQRSERRQPERRRSRSAPRERSPVQERREATVERAEAKGLETAPFSPSSYTSTAEAEAKEEPRRAPPGNFERRSPRETGGRRTEAKRGRDPRSSASEPSKQVIRTDLPAELGDPQSAEYKELIKRQYFEDLEKFKKQQIKLEEGPGGQKKPVLPEGLLKVQGDSEERQKKAKEPRKKRKWTWA